MTHRPEITAANYAEVYNYYTESRLKPHVSSAIFRACSMLYSPDVYIADSTRNQINEQLGQGKGALIAMNHPSHHDPFVGAAGMQRSGIPELTDCMAFAKDSLFRGATLPLFEYTGCVPVFRHKSYPDLDRHTFNKATNSLLELAAHRLQDGQTVSILPEGTTSRPEARTQLEMQDIKSGIARVALLASDEQSFIIPMAIAYRPGQLHQKFPPRHAVVTLGDPVTEYATTSKGLREQVLEAMQGQLAEANSRI